MNKLEEQIKKQCDSFYQESRTEDGNGPLSHFEQGAQFVIDLELPVKFAEWVRCTFVDVYNLDEFQNLEQAYEFWIENIYGK